MSYSFTKAGLTSQPARSASTGSRRRRTNLFANNTECRRQRRHPGRVDRSVRLGRAEPVVQPLHQPARPEPVDAHRSDARPSATPSRRSRGKQTIALRRRLSRHPRRQPDRRQRARQLRVHRPLHRHRFRATFCSACRSRRRVQFGPGAGTISFDVVGSVRAGRLARDRQGHRQRGTALRVLLAGVRSRQSARDARRARRTSPPPSRWWPARPARYSGPLPDTIVRPFRAGLRAARRHRLAAQARHRSCAPATASTTTRASTQYHRAATRRSAAVRHREHGARRGRRRSRCLRSCNPRRAGDRATPFGTTTNTYGVDPDYRLGYVQIWNLDLQRDLTRTVQLGIGYTGTKGSESRHAAARPNRGPTGC